MADDPAVLTEIARTFGAQFTEGGVLQRKALRVHVFSDPARKARLDAIFHDRIYDVLAQRLRHTQGNVVVSIPLYFECGRTLEGIDAVWTVTASEHARIKRIVLRDNTTEEQARAVLRSQCPDAVRVAGSDRVYYNDGDFDSLTEQVAAALDAMQCPSAKPF